MAEIRPADSETEEKEKHHRHLFGPNFNRTMRPQSDTALCAMMSTAVVLL